MRQLLSTTRSVRYAIAFAAVGLLFAIAACVTTVDLTNGADDYGYQDDQHVALPWRMVPPVKSTDWQQDKSDPQCTMRGKSEACAFFEGETHEKLYRYSAAAAQGTWPLSIGLEYVCERREISRTSYMVGTLDGREAERSAPNFNDYISHKRYLYYTIGGFTPGATAMAFNVDGEGPIEAFGVGEQGKYLEITDDFVIDQVVNGQATTEIALILDDRPLSAQRGSITFEMEGARKKFESVDRLCFNRVE